MGLTLINNLTRWIGIVLTAVALTACGSSSDDSTAETNDSTENNGPADNNTPTAPDSGIAAVNQYANGWILISLIRESVDEGDFVENSRHEFAYDLGTNASVTETILRPGINPQTVALIRVDANGFPVDGHEDPDSANPKPIQFTFTANAKLSALRTNELVIDYEYAGTGQLSRLTRTGQDSSAGQSPVITDFTQASPRQIVGQVSRDGQSTHQITYQLDASGRVSQANVQETSAGVVREYLVSYDSASNPTQIIHTEAGQPVARTRFIHRQASRKFFNLGLMPFGIEEPALLPRP